MIEVELRSGLELGSVNHKVVRVEAYEWCDVEDSWYGYLRYMVEIQGFR